ncbi:ribosomal-protein-alanine acetyltransferase [Geotalea uraniireducens]|uniref:Ribosomal-protein-alanine acetyltransferase n=2 Tax=Geotalea uraniireducens TaxID=351604 RepID=A0ABM8EL12_9BACT|nr:ribosomal-protein-alanine acetyltransferase [Geotalea uraniireducens]
MHIMRQEMGAYTRVSISPMSYQDLDEVIAIEAESFSRPWNRDHFAAELQSPHSFPLAARNADGRIAGYICPMLVHDEGEILDVAVAPGYRGQGIGRQLLQRALGDLRQRGAAVVMLEVRISNMPAIELYRRAGFSESGSRKRYYENGEDALLMTYHFE